MTNRFQKFAFSLISTRPHDTDTVAFSNLSTLEIVFESTSFSLFSCGRDMKTQKKCSRFQMKTHPCGYVEYVSMLKKIKLVTEL